MNNRKILAVDFGEKHVGLAVTDSNAAVVFSRGEISGKKSLDGIFSAILATVEEEDAVKVVFGIPEAKEGADPVQPARLRRIGKKLKDFLAKSRPGTEVVFYDESFSSFEAGVFIKNAGGDSRFKKKHSEHEIAAMIILNKYLAGPGRDNSE